MRYSEMKAFENEKRAQRAHGGIPPRLVASAGGLPWWPFLAMVMVALLLASCGSAGYRDPIVQMQTAGPVDLERYQGRWYEIARFPNRFEEGCVAVTADYTLAPDGTMAVLNSCRQGTLDGPIETAEGIATSVSPDNDKLEVTFVPWLPLAKGDYWILDLDPDYSVAVIGNPAGTTGWILARTPDLPDATLERAFLVLGRNGYDTDRILMTRH